MSEALMITPSEKENHVFNASLQDVYYNLSLKNGDTVDIVLVVTDNLRREEQFIDSMSVHEGELERKPVAAPIDSFNN